MIVVKKSNLVFYLLLIISSVFLQSCATLINGKKEKITIITKIPAQIALENNELYNFNEEQTIIVDRKNSPLKVSYYNEDSLHIAKIESRNSIPYLLNFIPYGAFLIGAIIDYKSPKRYSYPRFVTINNDRKIGQKYLPYDYRNLKKYNSLKITPLRLYDFVNPTFEFSYERKLNDSYSIQVLFGQIFNYKEKQDGLVNSPDLKIKGNRKAIELKHYLKKSAPIGPYISLEYSRLNSNSDKIMSFDKSKPDSLFLPGQSYYYEDTIKVNRKINMLNLKFGYQIIRKKTSFDFFIGTGIRNRNVTHSNRFNSTDQLTKTRHGSLYYSINRPGSWYTGSLALNVKIGIAF